MDCPDLRIDVVQAGRRNAKDQFPIRGCVERLVRGRVPVCISCSAMDLLSVFVLSRSQVLRRILSRRRH